MLASQGDIRVTLAQHTLNVALLQIEIQSLVMICCHHSGSCYLQTPFTVFTKLHSHFNSCSIGHRSHLVDPQPSTDQSLDHSLPAVAFPIFTLIRFPYNCLLTQAVFASSNSWISRFADSWNSQARLRGGTPCDHDSLRAMTSRHGVPRSR